MRHLPLAGAVCARAKVLTHKMWNFEDEPYVTSIVLGGDALKKRLCPFVLLPKIPETGQMCYFPTTLMPNSRSVVKRYVEALDHLGLFSVTLQQRDIDRKIQRRQHGFVSHQGVSIWVQDGSVGTND